nr:immunoglobulin light chain junction region [Macaca mulatta]
DYYCQLSDSSAVLF